jgi:hypothetical protein
MTDVIGADLVQSAVHQLEAAKIAMENFEAPPQVGRRPPRERIN